jgi:glucose-1-phosphate thymidylyltransferase
MATQQITGVVPMAGRATRISPLPMSKELYPVSLRETETGARPKVASHYLLERMRLAGVRQTYLVIRDGKWDIPAYYNDGTQLLDMHLAYVMMRLPHGAPFSVDAAHPFVKDAIVVMGFPDILFSPADAFSRLLAKQRETRADLVLGLYRWDNPKLDDMVDSDDDGRVRALTIKEDAPHLRYTWAMAAWSPIFTEFMHTYLAAQLQSGEALRTELSVGHVVRAAVIDGLNVHSVAFPEGKFLDIGTSVGLKQIADFDVSGGEI